MPGSRLHKIGTIYSRAKGLLRSGAWQATDKPIWYDVYEAFPPRVEPSEGRIEDRETPVQKLFYPEDLIRATFYKRYGNIGIVSLNEARTFPSVSQVFVEEYQRIEKEGQYAGEELIKEVEEALRVRGIHLDRSQRAEMVLDQKPIESSRESFSKAATVNLASIFSEQLQKESLEDASHVPESDSSHQKSPEVNLTKIFSQDSETLQEDDAGLTQFGADDTITSKPSQENTSSTSSSSSSESESGTSESDSEGSGSEEENAKLKDDGATKAKTGEEKGGKQSKED